MKQLLQRLDSGETFLLDVPVPQSGSRSVVIETRATVVSIGTERMLVEFGRAGLLDKARQQPEKVKQVLDKIRTDGLLPTIDAVRSKLDQPIPLGYCQAGVVVDAGAASAFKAGDRVVSNGPHAEYVRVPCTLAARIPDSVGFEEAAFTPLAAIGLQGIRLASPTLGETVVVYGLGLIGLLCVQILRANGCRVIGIDRDAARLALAERFGAVALDGSVADVSAQVLAATQGIGADAVLMTLASSSDEPMHEAALMSRKRGRVVLVGTTGLALRRDDFYKKELSLQVSCSYGPGRYDPSYEDEARDYPLAHVRWTEQRNFDAVLELMARGQLDPRPLVTHRVAFADAPKAYEALGSSLGIVLTYAGYGGSTPPESAHTIVRRSAPSVAPGRAIVSVIGAGNFASRVLLPLVKANGGQLRTIASSGGTSGAIVGAKLDADAITSSVNAVLRDESDTVFILTRHDSHARLAGQALAAGKHVFVEKPLAITEEELDALEVQAREAKTILTVGFNRRFAPLTVKARQALAGRAGPLSVIATINAGKIPAEHWTQDSAVGGGRIIGEACHWIDLARSLVGAPISGVRTTTAATRDGDAVGDIAHIVVEFADGSTAVVHYLASGAASFPKERIECFFDGKTLVIDNWRRLRGYGVATARAWGMSKIDKGHGAEVATFLNAVRAGGPPPIAYDELFEVARWSIRAGARSTG